MERAYIYGDSLLKATVPDAAMRYHFIFRRSWPSTPRSGWRW